MLPADHCRTLSERYDRLAWAAKSPEDRQRCLRLKRSYELMVRSADFGTRLDELIARLRN
jgi:hypothetical protein